MSRDESIKHIAGIIKEIKFAEVTTVNAEGHLHARPLTTQQTEFDGDLWFIVGKDSGTVADVQTSPEVNASYSDPGKNVYLSIAGRAELVEDRAKLEELWSDFYKAYFEGGIDDPNVQLLKINAHGAEYWEDRHHVRNLVQMAVAAVTGKTSNDHGTNETVKL